MNRGRSTINDLVTGMEALISRTLGENVELKVDVADGSPKVLIDPSQFESSILNLAINARDAMPNGGLLTIETQLVYLDHEYAEKHPEVVPGHHVLVAVSDTGGGMTPELLEKVFHPFFTTKENGKGTGLGLSMVYGFIKQSGGHISIYSEVGHGTSVKMYLPRKHGRRRYGDGGLAAELRLRPQRIAACAWRCSGMPKCRRKPRGGRRSWWSKTRKRCAPWPAASSWISAMTWWKRKTASRPCRNSRKIRRST